MSSSHRPSSQAQAVFDIDVLIVGAGLVGSTLACALQAAIDQYGLRVAVVESNDLANTAVTPPSFDSRNSAISWHTRTVYEQLGLWQRLAERVGAIESIHVSEQGRHGEACLSALEVAKPALGYVIKNHQLGDVLLRRLQTMQQQGQLTMYAPNTVSFIQPVAGGMSVALSGTTISAALVVLADGRRSGLLEQLHIEREQHDYQQQAITFNVAMTQPHHHTAYERFVEHGAIALLPLADSNQAGMVWTLDSARAEQLQAMDDNTFLAELQHAFGYDVGEFYKLSQRYYYPLALQVAKEQVRSNLVVLGNAAHALHPIAGQGYNLAVRDVMALVRSIESSLVRGVPIGHLTQLLAYESVQIGDQKMVLQFCDSLVGVFTRDDRLSVLGRNAALNVLNRCRPLRQRFTRKAMGC